MALPRRRLPYDQRIRSLIPVISAVSGAILFLFALLSFLAPVPLDSDQFHRGEHLSTSRLGAEDDDEIPKRDSTFHVPRSWPGVDRDIWSSRNSGFFYGCSNATRKFAKAEVVTHSNRFLAIATSGGLNQQRTGIVDAVVVARILNATLVIPKLDQKSYWKDASDFSGIFDIDWFISFLSNDVKIIKQLPRRGGKAWTGHPMRVPRKCSERCYINRVLPVLLKRHAMEIRKFDYRLANKLDTDLQKLRCRVNYHALRFTDPIVQMGKLLVDRMKMRSSHYIALHLRFEPDMLAFSGCDYGGGEKEKTELGAIRRRWKTLHKSNPDRQRRQGRCPLTPEEVGLMLRALGYGSDVHIYVASGEVYGGEETLAPLKALFPYFYSKDTIATREELEPFSSFSSRMAALDFIVCDESNVFVTNNNGNMARMIAGRRRYFGHKPTIRPNAKKLYRLFLNRNNMTWESFAGAVHSHQRGFMGEPNEVRPGRGEFHENPSACICEDLEAKAKANARHRKQGKGVDATEKDSIIDNDRNDDDDDDDSNDDETNDPEWTDPDDDEYHSDLQEKGLSNGTLSDYETVTSDEPELAEILSD